jgi:proteic killer suppression protein
MTVKFADKTLKKIADNDRARLREYGKFRSEKIRLRLAQLNYAKNLEQLRMTPGNYHELTGNRKGQWACDLDQPYRLIFTPCHQNIPINEDGTYDWEKVTEVEIIEITDYH